MEKVDFLRKKYPKFIYEKYSYEISGNNLEIFFDFRVEPDISFKPKVTIENIDKSQMEKVEDRALNNLIFNLGLMEIPSYWKVTCSPEIEIKAGPLSMKASPSSPSSTNLRFVSMNQEQIKWWKDLIINGMGQFFYENKIDFHQPNFLKINRLQRPVLCKTDRGPSSDQTSNQILVPISGGKDSVVTLEILKKAKKSINCFSLNPTEAAKKIMKIVGFNNPIIVKRTIDPKLLELNRRGFLNGHTPFSAYLAFLSVLVAVLFEYKYIAFSNERSSNEGNVKYLGKIINHQWSKSFEFEKKFRDYSKKYLAPQPNFGGGLEYFSFLRPFYEIQIAKLFSKYPKYFNAFLSCNVAYQTASGTKLPAKKWCGKCSKCLFVFAILYPFVGKKNPPSRKATEDKELLKIFGKNLFENKKLLPVMLELIGERRFKPFECVGTKKESLIAFYLSWKKYKDRVSVELPFLLKYFEEKILPKYQNLKKESEKTLSSWNNQNNLPKEFEEILKKMVS